ncbi:hypothetical protein HMPREF0208_00173 [Citrobacter koseri]|nr:hypothetical protein HMPREF0208_00173 [Citrobacter koseri]
MPKLFCCEIIFPTALIRSANRERDDKMERIKKRRKMRRWKVM